jgi:gliding motility-associated-like protein
MDVNGCVYSTSATITSTSGPTAIATNVTNATCGGSNGTLTLGVVTGGVGPFTYSVDVSAYTATTSYTNLSAGTHSIDVQDANGCIFSTTASIGNTDGPTAIATTVVNAACGSSNGSITLGAVTGGLAPFTYSVDGGAFTATTSYPNMAAGTYAVEVRDANSCTFSTTASVSNTGGPTAIATTIVNTTCGASNGSITLGAVTGGAAPYTYSVDGSPFTAITSYANMTAGTYAVEVSDANGCIFATSAIITNTSGPTSIVTNVTDANCGSPDGTLTIVTVTGGSSPYTYSINGSSFTSTANYTNLAAGTYIIVVRDVNGCEFSSNATIADPATPKAPIIGSVTQPTCADATGEIVLDGLPSGTWTVNPGAITGSGVSTTIPGLYAGTYNFTVTNATGCISPVSSDVLITAFPGAPTAPITGTVTQPTCAVATGSVEITGLPAGVWAINPGSITGTGSGTTITGLTDGIHNFTVTNDAGCISPVSADILITAFPGAPLAPTIGLITLPTCTVLTGTIELNGLPDGNWIINPGAISGTGASITIPDLTAGTYNFTVTNSDGCISPLSVNAVIGSGSGPAVAAKELSDYNGFNVSCSGSSDGFIRLTLPRELAFYSFSWNGPGGFTSSEKDISGLKAGHYTLLITDVNNCSSNESFELKEPMPLSMTIAKSVSSDGNYNINCAGAGTGSASVEAVNNAGSVSYLWNDGFTGNNRTNLLPGNYHIIITDSNNCSADSSITLTAPDSLKLAIEVTQPFCPDKSDGAINLTVTGGVPGTDYIYTWSDNSTGKNLIDIPEGLYVVDVADLNGCSVKDSVQVDAKNQTCLIIPNAFSPNGDLINDVWNIANIDQYPLAEVKVFNNWGVTVWKSEQGYPQPWDGRSNGIALPIDSYFYIINLHNGTKLISGSVTIIK